MFVKQEHKATVQEKRMVLKVQGGGEGEQERAQARRGRRETKLGAWLRGRDAGKGMKTGQPKTAW